MLGIDQGVTDEACATDHADEFFFRESIPFFPRHLRVINLDFVSRLHVIILSPLLIGLIPTAPVPISCAAGPSPEGVVSFRWTYDVARLGMR